MDVAVLMACHNRREQTLRCLERLQAQGFAFVAPGTRADEKGETRLSIFLVDDGSTDGTGAAVHARFPVVCVIKGDGSLYWCGGMRVAWEQAAATDDFDAYLWLNDDTMLLKGAVDALLQHSGGCAHQAIMVGACRDPETGVVTYGGMTSAFVAVTPGAGPIECESFNGNVVLVSREVYQRIGGMNACYRHSLGDVDYAERAIQAGIKIVLVPGWVGTCRRNAIPRWQRPEIPFSERWRALHEPKGCPPREYARFSRLKNGWIWPVSVAKLYCRVLLPRLWIR